MEGKRGRGKTRIERYSENKVTNSQEARWREKLVDIVYKYPYRKPTQVDEERILRRAGEALLRNSANWPRNFGIRGAYVKVGRRE